MKSIGSKKNNLGMTLVELIVAVAIFVAAIVPMLYAFVYSTGYNFKSQMTMQSTGIAQALIEKTKESKHDPTYKPVLTRLGDGTIFENTNFSGGTLNALSTTTDYYYDSVIAANNSEDAAAGYGNRRAYDVHLHYAPIEGSVYDYASIQAMSHDSTASFSDADTDTLSAQDDIALDKLLDIILTNVRVDSNVTIKKTSDGSTVPTSTIPNPSSYFSNSDINIEKLVIDRSITITAADDGVVVTVKYFSPGCDEDFDGSGEDIVFTSKTVVYGGVSYEISLKGTLSGYSYPSGNPVYTADFDGTPTDGYKIYDNKATAIYFYFYPGYRSRGTGLPGYRDYFVIDNNMTVSGLDDKSQQTKRLNVFLFKQYNELWDGVDHSPFDNLEKKYNPSITMEDANFSTYLYNNFIINCRDGSSLRTNTDSYANNPESWTPGANCYNETKYLDLSTYYFHETLVARSLPSITEFSSLLLEDQACLPFKHEVGMDFLDETGVAYNTNMFRSRYEIYVEVFRAGYSYASDWSVERIDAETLNW